MLNVICVKVGNKYGPEYVNRLSAAVERNLMQPYGFTCITDQPDGIIVRCGVDRISAIDGMALIADDSILTSDPTLSGWWQKMALFQQCPWGTANTVSSDRDLQTRYLYLDLDVVITGPLDDLVDYPSQFVMHPDFQKPWKPASAVMVLDAGRYTWIWEHFNVYRYQLMKRFHGDQAYIYSLMQDNCSYHPSRQPKLYCDLFPQRWVKSYKMHAQDGPPDDCRVVCFHGEPKPADCGGWVKERW